MGVEAFTLKKLLGVLASFAGILLISGVDISGDHEADRGTFPYKSPGQIAVGDALAFFSALLYGVYASVMKKKLGDESRVNMLLFFGMVGLCNVVTMLPGFPILHAIGIETFQLPPTKRIWLIIVVSVRPLSSPDLKIVDGTPGQLVHISALRRLLGLCNATDLTIGRYCRIELNDSALACWPNDSELADLKRSLLGWWLDRTLVLHFHQSREQRAERKPQA